MLVYRELDWSGFVEAVMGAVRTTAMVLLVIGTAASFGWLMAFLQVQTLMIATISAISDNPIIVLLVINVILLLLGTFMDMAPMVIISTPVLLPVVKSLRHRSRAFRCRDDPERRYRSQYAAGRNGALRGMCGWRHNDTGSNANDLAVLRRQHSRAARRHLYSVAFTLAAVTFPVVPKLYRNKAPLCRGLFHFGGKQLLLFVLVKRHQIAVPAASYPVHVVAGAQPQCALEHP